MLGLRSCFSVTEVLGCLQEFTMLSLNSLLYVLRFLATGGAKEYISMLMD